MVNLRQQQPGAVVRVQRMSESRAFVRFKRDLRVRDRAPQATALGATDASAFLCWGPSGCAARSATLQHAGRAPRCGGNAGRPASRTATATATATAIAIAIANGRDEGVTMLVHRTVLLIFQKKVSQFCLNGG
jgi:hypothetical protein